MWAVLKQLLSTNWLKKSAVKGEVSLVSCRNFWICLVRTKRSCMAHVSPSLNCLSSNGMRVAIFRFFVIVVFEDKQGISLTTWMVVCETDKWNTNFKLFCHFFLLFAILNGNYFETVYCCFWRKQIIPFVLIVFFFWAFVFVTKIYICPKDLLLLSIINEMS